MFIFSNPEQRQFRHLQKLQPCLLDCSNKLQRFLQCPEIARKRLWISFYFFLISHLVTVNQLSTLSTPNMNTFVKTSACQKFSIRRKCNAVNWFFVSKLICSKENYQNNCYLVRVWTHDPLSTSQSLTVESKLAEAKTRFMFGLLVPGPVGLHFMV